MGNMRQPIARQWKEAAMLSKELHALWVVSFPGLRVFKQGQVNNLQEMNDRTTQPGRWLSPYDSMRWKRLRSRQWWIVWVGWQERRQWNYALGMQWLSQLLLWLQVSLCPQILKHTSWTQFERRYMIKSQPLLKVKHWRSNNISYLS